MGAIMSFLGGSAFRAIWGEFSGWLNARQEHKHELERLKIQEVAAAAQHARNMEAQKLQAELGFKTIRVQADSEIQKIETEAWKSAIERMQAPTGVKWVDGWNGVIRPSFATAGLLLWLWWEFHLMAANGWVVSVFSLDLIAVIVGFYFADRSLAKRGK